MARYDVNAVWDDPFERSADRRAAVRFELKVRVSITVESQEHRHRLVGPGAIRNISSTGAYLITKHALKEGQRVLIAIPTVEKPVDLLLPEAFVGPAEVIRVESDEENRVRAALRFADELVQNLEFAMYMRHLKALHGAGIPTPVPHYR